jgi:hypothetical protein
MITESQARISKAYMIEHERNLGFTIVRVGEADFLPESDWLPGTIVSTDGARVRLVALLARKPGHGAFRRLVKALIERSFEPVVVEPFARLQDHLEREGWKRRRIERGQAGAHEVWYPRRSADGRT